EVATTFLKDLPCSAKSANSSGSVFRQFIVCRRAAWARYIIPYWLGDSCAHHFLEASSPLNLGDRYSGTHYRAWRRFCVAYLHHKRRSASRPSKVTHNVQWVRLSSCLPLLGQGLARCVGCIYRFPHAYALPATSCPNLTLRPTAR